MGYTGEPLASLFEDDFVDETSRAIVDEVGKFLLDRVQHHTPVHVPLPGQENFNAKTVHERWRERGGRRPGTLRDSWYRNEVVVAEGDLFVVTVATDDPIAPYVEYPTRPHVIRPKDPDGYLRFRVKPDGHVVFAQVVQHPGTEGSYMMQKALADVRGEWQAIARRVIAEHAVRYNGG